MRKNKVLKGGFVSAAVALAMAVALVGCTPMSEVVPEKYGEWDGYYVYRGNVRSKTTGEEDVYLVETLEKDGVIYSVTATNDYLYQEDDIWLCLEIAPQNEIAGKTPYTSCLVRYDMENWQATPIYYGYEFDADNVHLVKEDVIVLSREGKQEVFYTVDYYGNVVEENAWRYGEYEYFADRAYAVKTEKGKISFAPVSTENFTTIFVSNAQEQEVYFVSNAHQKGFVILETNVYTGEDGHQGMYNTYDRTVNALHFYDITQGQLTTLLSMDEGKVCTFTEVGGYFVTATEKVYRYKTLMNKGDELRRSECALYGIGGGNQAWLLYEFDGELIDSDFTRQILPVADGIYLEADILHKGGVFKSWGNGVYTYLLDLETESLKKTNDVPFYDEAKKGFTFGRSLYYIDELYLDGDGWYAYKFIRRDTVTGKEEVLQCWCDNDYGYYDDLDLSGDAIDLGKGKMMRFSEKMWAQYLVEDYNYYACPFPDDFIIRTR